MQHCRRRAGRYLSSRSGTGSPAPLPLKPHRLLTPRSPGSGAAAQPSAATRYVGYRTVPARAAAIRTSTPHPLGRRTQLCDFATYHQGLLTRMIRGTLLEACRAWRTPAGNGEGVCLRAPGRKTRGWPWALGELQGGRRPLAVPAGDSDVSHFRLHFGSCRSLPAMKSITGGRRNFGSAGQAHLRPHRQVERITPVLERRQ